jgi:hypothetical protein
MLLVVFYLGPVLSWSGDYGIWPLAGQIRIGKRTDRNRMRNAVL